jgi:acetyl esterase/lipase
MPLDPQARLLLDFLASQNVPDLSTLVPRAARLLFAEHRARSPPLPVLLWFHGGGHVIGSVPESDSECRELATLARCAVVSVEYRLAPEHPFPAAADDCFTATKWVAEHAPDLGVDASRIAVGGDSAGGNLAAVVSLMARDRGGPALVFQLLVYPGTDYASLDTKSHHENAEGYFLTRSTMRTARASNRPA